MRAAALLLTLVTTLAGSACGPGESSGTDGGVPDGGAPDGGGDPVPAPFPLVRMDKPQAGSAYTVSIAGVVEAHGSNDDNPPAFGEVYPARRLLLRSSDGHRKEALYYTLPAPFAFAARPGDPLTMLYREQPNGFESSHGVVLTRTGTGALVIAFEDGTAGPALTEAERLGLTFELDEVLALDASDDPCGRRIRYPVIVGLEGVRRRVMPGGSLDLALAGGAPVRFTLLDASRVEDTTCPVPPFSLGWILQPR